jgi:HprK-related kinase A
VAAGLVIDQLSPSPLSLLSGAGVQVTMGPFLVRIRAQLAGVREYLERLYIDFPMSGAEGGHFDLMLVGGGGVRRWWRPQARLIVNGATPFLPLPATLAGPLLEWGLNWCIGNAAHRWIAVHAAVVERKGHAMILPASPGAGKSTLCAALACDGWRFFSDEFALIDPDHGRVQAIPRPISLKNASMAIIRARAPQAVFGPERQDLEGARFVHMRPPSDSVRRAHESAAPRWLILPRYVAGARTRLDRLSKARALMRLADQSFNYNYVGPKGYACLTDVVRHSDCYTLEYSDLDEVLPLLTRVTAS